MKTLPNEIWSRIISHVVRDMPEPRSCKHWFGLHQHDLASLMRVNSHFHDLTGPHLYAKAVVACIVAFMRNIETTEAFGKKAEIKIIKPGIMTKKDLLAHTRELHLVYYPYIFEPSYDKIIAGGEQGSWRDVGVSNKEQLEREAENSPGARGAELADMVNIANVMHAAANDFELFPRLEKVTVGANGDRLWEQREPIIMGLSGHAGGYLRPQRFHVKPLLLAIIAAGQPKDVCLHAVFGPYAPPTDIIYNPTTPISLETFTVHLDDILSDPETFEVHLPPIICGVVNCWMYRFPTTRFNLSDWDDGEGMLRDWIDFLAEQLNEVYATWVKAKPLDGGKAIDLEGTTLDIIGCGDCTPLAYRLRMHTPNWTSCGEDEFHDALEQLAGADEKILAQVQAQLNSKLCAAWKGKVTLYINEDDDECEVCGDKPDERFNSFSQRLLAEG